jgi:enoyl-CoA hydratase/carnithine racemase
VSEVVSYEVTDGVAHVTIERPERKNAMSLEVFDQLTERAAEAAADDRGRGRGRRGRDGTFSSGIDVSVFGDQLHDGVDPDFIARLQAAYTAYEDLDKPTIAAIEGYCFGGGIQLAVACHLRAVAPDARARRDGGAVGARARPRRDLAAPAARRARPRDGAHPHRAAGRGRRGARDRARRDRARRGRSAGAGARARGPAGRRPRCVRRAPRLLRENLGRDRDAALRAEAETQVRCIEGPDFTEAVTAGLEGRDPRFVGR